MPAARADRPPSSRATATAIAPSRLARRWPLLVVSFVEGGALMAVELLGARAVAPYFGSSLYVWSIVLATTVGGLTAGYALGGRMAGGDRRSEVLVWVLAIAAALVALLPITSAAVMGATAGLDLRAAILVSCAAFLLPPLVAFGMVSPLVIGLVSTDLAAVGRAAGTVYAVSTVGGVVATFLYGFLLIPFGGVRASALATAAALALLPPLALLDRRHSRTAP
ncbi:MAG TPA: fused MFS/spermidine synthase [Candidatus Binatia bacterium]|nr:fused MFS/spermidine synthase [Candidatus Binatia bacterium]